MAFLDRVRSFARRFGRQPEDVIGQTDPITPPTPFRIQDQTQTTSTQGAINPPHVNTQITPGRLEQTPEGGARLIETDPTTGEDVTQVRDFTKLDETIGHRPEQANMPGKFQDKVITIDTKEGGQETIILTPQEYDGILKAIGITGRVRNPVESDSEEVKKYLLLLQDLVAWNEAIRVDELGIREDALKRAQFEAQFPGAIEEFEAMEGELTYEEAIATEQGARAVGHKGLTLLNAVQIGGEPTKQGIHAILALRATAAVGKAAGAGRLAGASGNPWIIGAAIVGGFFHGWNEFATTQAKESVTNADRIRADIEKGFAVTMNGVNTGGSGRQAMANFDAMEKSARIAQAILKHETRTKTAAQRSEGISELEELEDIIDDFAERRQELMNAILNPNPNAIRPIPTSKYDLS